MITLDVCLEMVLPGLSLAEKAKRVAAAGFRAVEFWFHDFDCERGAYVDRRLEDFARAASANGLTIHNAVVNSPDGGIGGKLVDPADHEPYLRRLETLIPLLAGLNCTKAITCAGNTMPGIPQDLQRAALVQVLREAARIAGSAGVTLLLEPLNTRVDHPGYFLDAPGEAAAIVREVGSAHLKLLFDVYHMQIMAGNVIDTIRQHLDCIGHFHSAGVPGRGELDSGELCYPEILRALDAAGYEGGFGLEYAPASGDQDASLRGQLQHLKSAGSFVV